MMRYVVMSVPDPNVWLRYSIIDTEEEPLYGRILAYAYTQEDADKICKSLNMGENDV